MDVALEESELSLLDSSTKVFLYIYSQAKLILYYKMPHHCKDWWVYTECQIEVFLHIIRLSQYTELLYKYSSSQHRQVVPCSHMYSSRLKDESFNTLHNSPKLLFTMAYKEYYKVSYWHMKMRKLICLDKG